MLTTAIRLISAVFLSLTLLACGDKVPRTDIEVNVTMNGELAPHARITMDGKLLGETGADGQFNASMNLQPGKQVLLEAMQDVAGFEVEPWKSKFTVKLPNEGEVLKYVYDVDLKAMPYVMFHVQEKGVPIAGAAVSVDKQEVGKTDNNGGLTFKYEAGRKQAANIEITKNGYSN